MITLELFAYPKLRIDSVEQSLTFTKPSYLLIYLACREDWVSRDELALFFRPDADLKTARHNLRLLLTRARKFAWAAALEQEGNRLRFKPFTDIAEFREALGKADWQTATELYKGEFLADAPSLGLVSFEAWLDVERAAFATAWQEAALNYAKQLEFIEEYEQQSSLLERVLVQDPLAEDVLQAYLRSAYLVGKGEQALSIYQRFKERLKQDLALEPLAKTLALVETIERSEKINETRSLKKADLPVSLLCPPEMIGRSKELSELANASIAIVLGEAGSGKTRLLTELEQDALVLSCREGLQHVPYLPIIEVLKTLELSSLGAYKKDLARLLPNLDVPSQESENEELAKAKLLEAIALALESQKKALIFDDLQWADVASQEVFVFMAHRQRQKVMASIRLNEYKSDLKDKINSLKQLSNFKELELKPLQLDEIVSLVLSLSSNKTKAKAFSEWLALKTGGNPFFILEMLRALFEADILKESASGWYSSLDSVSQAYRELAIPEGVKALIDRRLKGLSEEAKRMLEVASVLAEDINAELLAKLSGLSLWAVAELIGELEDQGLLNNERFSHDLLRQALYASLSNSKRKLIHKQIAKALDSSTDELIRAEHYYQAGDLAKAAELWFDVAAQRFTKGNFEAEATALFERIVSLDLKTASFYRAQARLAGSYHKLNRIKEKEELINNVLKHSQDTYARTFALLQKTTGHFIKGEISKAEESLKAAEKHIIDFNEKGIQRDVFQARVYLDYYQGRFDSALTLSERIMADKRLEPNDYGTVNWLSVLALIYTSVGRFEEALNCYQESYDISKDLNLVRNQVQTASDIMATLYDLGRIQDGLSLGEEALSLGDFDVSFPLRYHLALAYFEQQRFADAFAQCELVLKGDSSLNIQSHTHALVAELYIGQNNNEKAHEQLDKGLELIKSSDHKEARAVVAIAILKFGSDEQVKQVKAILDSLENLPVYLQRMFDEALALERYEVL